MQTKVPNISAAPSRRAQSPAPGWQRPLLSIAAGAALLGGATGCVVHESHHARVRPAPPPVYVQDDYVYYPGYEVYYSSRRRQYTYQDGRSWVSRPRPPHVSVDVLFASPSVRLDFHDAPSRHHAAVARQYPRHWTPAGDRGGGGRR